MKRLFEGRLSGSMILYAATSNPGKLREFRESAQGSGFLVEALPGLADLPEPVEDALTFMNNAELKAVAYSRAARERLGPGLLVFADDSGLEVDALGGKPGVRSARFAEDLGFEPGSAAEPGDRSHQDLRNDRNLRALLEQMAGVAEGERHGRFRCALALARDGEVLLRAEGKVEGENLREPRGVGGFGYDPVFFVAGPGKTLAEMSPEEKWAVSHRGEAFRALLEKMRRAALREDAWRTGEAEAGEPPRSPFGE